MKPGRRSFLMPGFLSSSPWAAFMQRLARSVQGSLRDDTEQGPGRASLRVARDEDVQHARALCLQYGVMLRLPASDVSQLPAERPWLTLDVAALDVIQDMDAGLGRVTVQAGCTFGALRKHLQDTEWSWPEGDDAQTVVEWLNLSHHLAPGHCEQSGLLWAEVMLASGEVERLGLFGADSVRPLRSAASGRLVAGLFEAAGSLDMAQLRTLPAWPGAYRLDALQPVSPNPAHAVAPNLSHVLLGSAGSLAWTGRVQLQLRRAGDAPASPAVSPVSAPRRAAPWQVEMADDQVKRLFDPEGLFPRPVV